jgi:RNA polymerase sigma-70 factor (ECF subfamily)
MTRDGDAEAYGALVARYQGHVYGLAYTLVDNWADAQDIAQETFIRAYVNLSQLADAGRFAAWLRRVTFGVAMNWLRAFRRGSFEQLNGRVDLDSLDIPDFRPGPPEIVERRELGEAVLQAISSLPDKYRLPLTMFHLNGLSYQKVADFLDIPLGTAKSLIHRAREKLRGALAPYAVEEVSPMVGEVFNEHKLPAEFPRKVVSLTEMDELTSAWWEALAEAQTANEEAQKAEAELLDAMEADIGEMPEWARQVKGAVPEWGFEICSHRWLEGLDSLIGMIGDEEFRPTAAGRCGDVPDSVARQAERLALAAQRWVDAGQEAAEPLDEEVAEWLGEPTPEKHEAARCFVELVRAAFFGPEEEMKTLAKRWRKQVTADGILERVFYGDGLDGGLESRCGFQTLRRLGIYLRIIGGDDSQLEETRWFCNTQMRHVLRDDPHRLYTTLGYLWGWQAYLLGHDEGWLQENKPEVAGAAIHALQGVSRAGAPTPLRRWLVASLLSTTRFWHQRGLNFAGAENAPAFARDVPDLAAALRG